MTAKRQYIDLNEAQAYANEFNIKFSKPTIIKYINNFDIGHQIGGKGGPYYVDKDKWRLFINGERCYKRNTQKKQPEKETES